MIQQRVSTEKTPSKIRFKKSNLLDYFRRISNYTISGIFVDSFGKSHESVAKFRKIAGVSPGIICTEMPSYTSNKTEWTLFVDEVIHNWYNLYLVHILWQRGNPLEQKKTFTDTNKKNEADRRWRDLIKEGGYLNKVWKGELDKIAPYLHKLQTAGVVPILDIIPLINSKYFIWKGRPGVGGSAKLYKITHDYLTKQHNLTSLVWSWSLSAEDMSQFEQFWPGNEYVDVASVIMPYNKILTKIEYERLINLAGDKPMAMERIWTAPSVDLLRAQPRWIWFTTSNKLLEDTYFNNVSTISATFSSPLVINNGNIVFFD